MENGERRMERLKVGRMKNKKNVVDLSLLISSGFRHKTTA